MAHELAHKKDTIVNGINVDQLFGTVEAIKDNPEIARFKFRAKNKWVAGTYNRASVRDFYGALREDISREPAVYDIDEPPVLLGSNLGTNPVEYLLVALSGCLTTTLIAQASVRGIEIRNVESRFEGDLDLRGFLGVSEDVPVGYERISVLMKIEADITDAEKEELIRAAKKYSPVYNSIARPVAVSVDLDGA